MSSSCDGVQLGRFSECTHVRVMYGCSNTTFEGVAGGGIAANRFLSRRIRAACKHLRHVTHFYQQEGNHDRFFELFHKLMEQLPQTSEGSASLLLTLWITPAEVCLIKPCPLAGCAFSEAGPKSLNGTGLGARKREQSTKSCRNFFPWGFLGDVHLPLLKLENMTDTLSLLSQDP